MSVKLCIYKCRKRHLYHIGGAKTRTENSRPKPTTAGGKQKSYANVRRESREVNTQQSDESFHNTPVLPARRRGPGPLGPRFPRRTRAVITRSWRTDGGRHSLFIRARPRDPPRLPASNTRTKRKRAHTHTHTRQHALAHGVLSSRPYPPPPLRHKDKLSGLQQQLNFKCHQFPRVNAVLGSEPPGRHL